MPQVIYIQSDGGQFEVEVPTGNSVMEGAIDNGIDGILAECGGSCTCATCHVYVDEQWIEKVGSPTEFEQDLLALVLEPTPNSRLSCQIKLTDDLAGLVVRLPNAQI